MSYEEKEVVVRFRIDGWAAIGQRFLLLQRRREKSQMEKADMFLRVSFSLFFSFRILWDPIEEKVFSLSIAGLRNSLLLREKEREKEDRVRWKSFVERF